MLRNLVGLHATENRQFHIPLLLCLVVQNTGVHESKIRSPVVHAILTDVLNRLMRPRLHEKVVEIEFPLLLDRRARAIHRDGHRSGNIVIRIMPPVLLDSRNIRGIYGELHAHSFKEYDADRGVPYNPKGALAHLFLLRGAAASRGGLAAG